MRRESTHPTELTDGAIKTVYIQHSKKLTIWALAQWVIVCVAVIALSFLTGVPDTAVPIIQDVITGSMTLTGIVVTGYMGNSAIEKYAAQRYSITSTIPGNEDENG